MTAQTLHNCRKCGTPNPAENAYCRKCGAVLRFSTTLVNAQPRPIMPDLGGIRWRFVWLGIFVILGLVSCVAVTALMIGSVSGIGANGILGIVADLFRFILLLGVMFIFAFSLAGVVLAWISKRKVTKEVVIASSVVIISLGMAGSTLTSDMLIVAGGVLVPSVAAAWLGAKFGNRRHQG